jgi:phenylalanyl-tRNA synthetase beta chain
VVGRSKAAWDFYALKAVVEAVIESASRLVASFETGKHPCLTRGRCARVLVGSREIGWMGEVKAEIRGAYDLPDPVYVAELDLEVLRGLAASDREYQPVSRFPAVTRDVALVGPRSVLAARAEEVIRATAGGDLESLGLFDAYEGKPLPEGQRNLAFSLTFRRHDRTLTDDEVEASMNRVRARLREELGARIRE